MIGGLFAAGSLAGHAGEKVVGLAKSGGNWVGGKVSGAAKGTARYAGNRTKQAVSAPLRGEKARNLAANLQQPGNNIVKRWTGRLMAGGAVVGGEQSIAKGRETIKGDSAELNRQKISTTANAWTRVARVGKAVDDKQVALMTSAEQEQYFGKDKEAMFKRYGPEGEKIYKDAREKSGLEARDLAKDSDAAMEAYVKDGTPENLTKFNEIEEKITALNRKLASTDPESLTPFFQSDENRGKMLTKAEKSGKPLPASLTLDEKTLRSMRESIIRSMAKGFSPANASGLINALSKNNNLNEFQDAIKKMKDGNPVEFKKLHDALIGENQTLLRWFAQNSGKALIDYKALFDIRSNEIPANIRRGAGQQQQQPPQPQTPPRPNAPKGPRQGPFRNRP
jgi:hypothetical protein